MLKKNDNNNAMITIAEKIAYLDCMQELLAKVKSYREYHMQYVPITNDEGETIGYEYQMPEPDNDYDTYRVNASFEIEKALLKMV